jgi:L-ascorbate metabolism protein UlaG (beta-lactamase superfamily)
MNVTYFGANSWLLEWGGLRILVDPWLVGSLVFGGLEWLFKGDRTQPIDALPENIDLILLSQGLEDHAHRPTLEALDRQIPVVASQNAAKVVEAIGYQHITALTPGETHHFQEQLEIRAFEGAPIGLQPENGYLIKHLGLGQSLYYEPHGFPPNDFETYAPVDVVISPVVNLELPIVGAILKGHVTAPQLAKGLKPKAFLPTAAGGDIDYHGILISVLRTVGGVDALRSSLANSGLTTQLIEPQPREATSLELDSPVA